LHDTETLFPVARPCARCGRPETVTEPTADVCPYCAHLDHPWPNDSCYWCDQAGKDGGKAARMAADASYGAAPANFVKAFRRELWQYAKGRRPFTSVDALMAVREQGYDAPEARSIGSIMRHAQAAGIIVPTGRYVPSPDPAHHSAPKREWIGTGTL